MLVNACKYLQMLVRARKMRVDTNSDSNYYAGYHYITLVYYLKVAEQSNA